MYCRVTCNKEKIDIILCKQVQVPKPLVGFVIGRNGEHINNIQNTCNVRLQFQNGNTHFWCAWTHISNCLILSSDIQGIDYRIATISGPPECCARARKMVQDIVAEVS